MLRWRTVACAIVIVPIASCRLGFDERVAQDAPAGYFRVGGTVTGLSGGGLVLQNNGADDLARSSDGAFQFATPIMDGEPYVVSISTPPTGQSCAITNASGVIAGAPIDDVTVTCFAAGACPPTLSFTANGGFTLPVGCDGFVVEALGGGGAGGAKNVGTAAAVGGAGGRAIKTFVGEAPGSVYTIEIGQGGLCGSRLATAGGYSGGGGGDAGGFGTGRAGLGTTAPPGGLGGAGSSGGQPGGAGGNGGYGGGGGGGGGDVVIGNAGGGATRVRLGMVDYVVAGGGGGAGASDQNGDIGGAGGAGCNGVVGSNGAAAVAGMRSGGGGGGGACACRGGCDATPSTTGGAGGAASTGNCTPAQNGQAGRVTITFP